MSDPGNEADNPTSTGVDENPFASLFYNVLPSIPPVTEPASEKMNVTSNEIMDSNEVVNNKIDDDNAITIAAQKPESENCSSEAYSVNEFIQKIFLFTVSEDHRDYSAQDQANSVLVLLPQLKQSLDDLGQTWIDLQHLEEAIFERLLLEDIPSYFSPKEGGTSTDRSEASESEVITYLCSCYGRLCKYATTRTQQWADKIVDKIFTNCLTCLLAPAELYAGQNCHQQFVDVFTSRMSNSTLHEDVLIKFLNEFVDFAEKSNDESLSEIFYPIFNTVTNVIASFDVAVSMTMQPCIDFLVALLKDEPMCSLFMDYHNSANNTNQFVSPVQFQQSLLGRILEKSTIVSQNSSMFFFKPSQTGKSEIQRQEENLKTALEKIGVYGFTVVSRILTHKSCAKKFHAWLADCVRSNRNRATLSGAHANDAEFASDGFFLNLATVCMKILHKFTKQHPSTEKVFKVDPTYCKMVMANSQQERDDQGVHFQFRDETFVTSLPEDAIPVGVRPPYEPLTELFFLTHKVFHLAFYRVNAKLQELLKHLRRLEQARQANSNSQGWLQKFDMALARFFANRVALNEPMFTTMTVDFLKTSAVMMCHYALSNSRDEDTLIAKLQVVLNETQPRMLSCFPEIIVENISEFLLYNRRFNEGHITPTVLADFQAFFIMFMSYKERLTNPHLRAKLAECLELTLAHDDFESRDGLMTGRSLDSKKADGFKSLPLKNEVGFAIIKIFVDIEQSVTGDEIHFEQKFTYRRPMIKMLDIMWTIAEYKESIQKLANYAIENIEAANVPVFVRFVNLLLNDSIFLLDEGMQYIVQIRTMERERESGEWARLGMGAMQREANLRQLIHMANFHCVTATDIVHSLRCITAAVKDLFLHPTFVDRVASMLNYFLKKLVGSERANLAVKSRLGEIEFKAKKLVKDICYIYANLAQEDHVQQLSAAIVRDGRSYSPDLFTSAVDVLYKISTSREEVHGEVTQQLIDSIELLSKSTKEAVALLKAEDDDLTDAPDEYLDPIMSILMTDPVILPTSGTTVDRSTIARHLLTDQSDPFNRQHLTMDQVQPNVALKSEIELWLRSKRNKQSIPSSLQHSEVENGEEEEEEDLSQAISIKRNPDAGSPNQSLPGSSSSTNEGEASISSIGNVSSSIDYSLWDNLD